MIKIGKTILKQQPNFWNHCIFHPTDAIEDPWGRRILDKISDDGAIGMVRIYSMFEDIVYISENGKLKNIPYKETADYVEKVNKAAEKYKQLYFSEQISE